MPRPRTVSDREIVAATVTAIGRHGPARLTLAHVADEVGLSPAALIQRFGSKAALLAAVAADGRDHADRAFDRAEAATTEPLEALVRALATFARDVSTPAELANHLAMLQLDLTDPALREQAAAQAATARARIRRLLDAAVAAGQLVPCATDRLARTVHVTYTGAALTWAMEATGSLAVWLEDHVAAVLDPYRADGRRGGG